MHLTHDHSLNGDCSASGRFALANRKQQCSLNWTEPSECRWPSHVCQLHCCWHLYMYIVGQYIVQAVMISLWSVLRGVSGRAGLCVAWTTQHIMLELPNLVINTQSTLCKIISGSKYQSIVYKIYVCITYNRKKGMQYKMSDFKLTWNFAIADNAEIEFVISTRAAKKLKKFVALPKLSSISYFLQRRWHQNISGSEYI